MGEYVEVSRTGSDDEWSEPQDNEVSLLESQRTEHFYILRKGRVEEKERYGRHEAAESRTIPDYCRRPRVHTE